MSDQLLGLDAPIGLDTPPQAQFSRADGYMAAAEQALDTGLTSSLITLGKRAFSSGEILSPEEANKRYDLGEDVIFDTPIPADMAQHIYEKKRTERRTNELLSRSRISPPEALGVSFLASFADPAGVASAFVPTFGLASAAARAVQATRGVTAARAASGAVGGFVGAVATEPLIYSAMQVRAADYDVYDSLANVAFGTALGSTLNVAGGAVGDVYLTRQLTENTKAVYKSMTAQERGAILQTAVSQILSRKPVEIDALLRSVVNARKLPDLPTPEAAAPVPPTGKAGSPDPIDPTQAFEMVARGEQIEAPEGQFVEANAATILAEIDTQITEVKSRLQETIPPEIALSRKVAELNRRLVMTTNPEKRQALLKEIEAAGPVADSATIAEVQAIFDAEAAPLKAKLQQLQRLRRTAATANDQVKIRKGLRGIKNELAQTRTALPETPAPAAQTEGEQIPSFINDGSSNAQAEYIRRITADMEAEVALAPELRQTVVEDVQQKLELGQKAINAGVACLTKSGGA